MLANEGVSEKTVLHYLGNILGYSFTHTQNCNFLLSITSHPLGKECARLVDEIDAQLSTASPQSAYDTIVDNVHNMLQTIVDMVLATYPELEHFGSDELINLGPNANFLGTDLVSVCVEMVTFPRIYPNLFELFKNKVRSRKLRLNFY